MTAVRVAAVALNQTARDWEGNQARILKAIETLRERQVSFACFPELCISGYGCEDGFGHPSTSQMALQSLQAILPHTKGIFLNLGFPFFFRKAVYNCSAVIADGKLLGLLPKKDLAGDGIHYEPRWFKPWPDELVTTARCLGEEVPIGDLFFDVSGVRVGFEICEEAWSADRPGRRHSQYAIDLEFNPSASHFSLGKLQTRELFVREGSRAFGSAYIYSNLLGCESGRQIYDGGSLIAVDGKIVSRSERLTFDEVQVTSHEIDLDLMRSLFAKKSWYTPEHKQSDFCVNAEMKLPEVSAPVPEEAPPAAEWEASETPIFEETSRAIGLALFDYLRKSRSKGFIVSLSGGVDSSSVAVMVRLMCELSLAALGKEELVRRLGGLGEGEEISDAGELTRRLLTTVWQGTKNNSEQTQAAAKGVAEAIGSTHYEISVDAMVSGYQELVEKTLGISLNYDEHDLPLQNLQARVRNPFPWMLANLSSSLLLTTSNRSESALGYCTMDGDTSGGLNPIGGLDKAYLRRWLVWMEKHGPIGCSHFPALSSVNALKPSAELRPQDSLQTDEAELGPYEVTSELEVAFMRYGKSPKEALALLERDFGKRYAREDLVHWTRKFFTLFSRNQWKRERLAPCFHVDHLNLDPRTWCRWPILNGGFERELKELK